MIAQNWLLLSAIGGFLLHTFKDYVKLLFDKILRQFIYTTTIYKTDTLYLIFEDWLYENHEKKYTNTVLEAFSTDGSKDLGVKVRQNRDFLKIVYKGKNIYINKGKDKIEGAKDHFSLFDEHIELRGFRKKDLILDLIKTVLDEYNKKRNSETVSIYVYRGGWFEYFDQRKVKTLDKVILDENLKKDLIVDLDSFLSKKEWYQTNGLFYKRNYLFYGPPGTGKTSLAFAIASKLNRDVYVLNLHTCKDLVEAIKNIRASSILLLEDIDVFFDQRKTAKDDKIDFSTLINFLDGAYSKSGLITIATTNHIEKLDPAAIRPGRMDFSRIIPNATEKEAGEYLSLYYGKKISIEENVNVPISKIQEIAMRSKSESDAISKILKTSSKQLTPIN